jgi:hypothetical protein
MADLPVLNALEELQSANKSGFKKIDASFVKGFTKLQSSFDRMANTLDKLFSLNEKMMQQGVRDNFALLEKMREDARKKDDVAKGKDKGSPVINKTLEDLLKLVGISAALLAADKATEMGFRGWELKAGQSAGRTSVRAARRVSTAVSGMMDDLFKTEKSSAKAKQKIEEENKRRTRRVQEETQRTRRQAQQQRRVPATQLIGDWFKGVRDRTLRVFGIDPQGTGKTRVTGKLAETLRGPGGLTISAAIGERFANLRSRFYRAIGLGVDGKPVVTTPKWLKETRKKWIAVRNWGGTVIDNVIESMRSIFGRIKTWLGFSEEAGAGAKAATKGPGFVARALARLGSALRKIPIIGQIVGAIMSVFQGLVAAFNTEGTFGDKAQAFFTTAIGDFFGAPLDLLKSLISWVMGKLNFKNVEKWLDSFSFKDQFIKLLNTVWDMGEKTIEWFGTLFENPEQAIQDLWDGVLGGVQSIGRWLKSLIPENFDPLGYLGEKITSILKWFYDSDTGDIFGGLLNLDLQKFKDSLPSFELPEFKIPDFENPFKGLGERIATSPLWEKLNFGGPFNFGDNLKTGLANLFGVKIPSGSVTAGVPMNGALVDRASRQSYDSFGNIVTVSPVNASSSVTNTNSSTVVMPANSAKQRLSPIQTEVINAVYGP